MKNRVVIKPIITGAVVVGLSAASGVAAAQEGPADPLTFMPETRAYTPGMQMPVGYRLTEGPRKPLLISGAVTFGVSYLPMVAFGIAGMSYGESAGGELIPVVGPFLWAFGYYTGPVLSAVFLTDSILQAAGIGLLIAGAVTPGKYLKREDIAAVMPKVSVGPRFVGMQWSF